MAYRILTKQHITSPRKAIGVVMPFSSDSVFVPTYSSLEAYKVNLYNFFLTTKGERVLDPEFGSELLSHLFTQMDEDSAEAIRETITFEIERYFPKIELEKVEVENYPDDNTCQISIEFKLQGTELGDELVLEIRE